MVAYTAREAAAHPDSKCCTSSAEDLAPAAAYLRVCRIAQRQAQWWLSSCSVAAVSAQQQSRSAGWRQCQLVVLPHTAAGGH